METPDDIYLHGRFALQPDPFIRDDEGSWFRAHGRWNLRGRFVKTAQRLDRSAGTAAFVGHVDIESGLIDLTEISIRRWTSALIDRARYAFDHGEYSPITDLPKLLFVYEIKVTSLV